MTELDNPMNECSACNGYGIRFVRVIYDIWERNRKGIKPCRKCHGKGFL